MRRKKVQTQMQNFKNVNASPMHCILFTFECHLGPTVNILWAYAWNNIFKKKHAAILSCFSFYFFCHRFGICILTKPKLYSRLTFWLDFRKKKRKKLSWKKVVEFCLHIRPLPIILLAIRILSHAIDASSHKIHFNAMGPIAMGLVAAFLVYLILWCYICSIFLNSH